MSKVQNIAVLDVRNIVEDLAASITEMRNIGVLIESDKSQLYLKNCEKKNIGATLKIADGIKIILQNGEMHIDNDFLESIPNISAVLVNGCLTFEDDIDAELFDEKIYSVVVNGELICSKKLAGIIQTKGIVNGEILKYNNSYKFISDSIKLSNNFLKSLKPESKLAIEKIFITEKINADLLKQKISNIQVLDKLIIVDELEDLFSSYIDDYYKVNKVLIPESKNGIKYINSNVSIDDISLKKYDHNTLYVDGNVQISLSDTIDFNKYIEHLVCHTITCSEKTYDIIKNSINDDAKVEIINGKLIKNTSKLVLTGKLEEPVTIKNLGKLIFDENFDYDNFDEDVIEIINYGVIEAPKDKLNTVNNKVTVNHGKVKCAEQSNDDNSDNDILYENIAELTL